MLCLNCQLNQICKLYEHFQSYAPSIIVETKECQYYMPILHKEIPKSVMPFLHPQAAGTEKTIAQETIATGTCFSCNSENVVLKTCARCGASVCEACCYTQINPITERLETICETCWEKE